MECSSPVALPRHVVIFPFFAKGHTIPLLRLAHLLHHRRLAAVTFITTPLNAPFIRRYLSGIGHNIIELPFPENAPGIPAGIESTDQLPSMSLFIPFLMATRLLQPPFEGALAGLPAVALLISDMFFEWTVESASKFAIPRVMFSGMGQFAYTIHGIIPRDVPYAGITDTNQPFKVQGLPHLELTRADLDQPVDNLDTDIALRNIMLASRKSTAESHGVLANTFYELEAPYVDHWNREFGPDAWCVGPLCLSRPKEAEPAAARGELMQWLDMRSETNRPVLYVAFGTQAELSAVHMEQIEVGLEGSGVDFVWVVRSKESEAVSEGFEARVGERGRVVKGWVDQWEILRHEGVKGFLSHCGWNSVMESVCAGVPILAWPMMAEQRLNAKFVVDELGIGLRIRAGDGTQHGLVRSEDIASLARDLLMGENGKMAAAKAGRLAVAAEKAMLDGGSSVAALEQMIDEVARKRIG